MINRRVIVNLVAFLALFVLLATWAVRNVVKLDRIERPYEIVAEFESSPGLQPNVEATYLGVSIGSIDSVSLADDHVRVVIDVDRGVEIPEGISAAVRRKSAVGEPYIALDPPEGAGEADLIDPSAGYTVPLERTSIPLSYGQLFSSVDELVSAVPAEDLGIVLHELATALDGRGPRLREIIAGSEAITTTLAQRSEALDELASDLTALTATLSSRSDGIGSAFDDLAALTGALAESRADLDRLLEEAPGFGAQVQSLLQATYADLSCTFADVGAVFDVIGTDARIADLVRVLQLSPLARDSLDSALVQTGEDGADGPYLGGSFGIVPGATLPEHATEPTLPDPPATGGCDARGAAGVAVPGAAGAADLDAEREVAGGELDVPARVAPGADEHAASTRRDVGGRSLRSLLLLGGAVLLAALLLVVRPWHWLPRAGRGGGDSDDG